MSIRPEVSVVESIVRNIYNEAVEVKSVLKGSSTYVFQLKCNEKISYIRFLKEEDSFDTEVLVHKTLLSLGLKIPKVLFYEKDEPLYGFSYVILDEVAGECIEDDLPKAIKNILIEAGKELASLHQVKVNGFGWVDKKEVNQLMGVKESFKSYYNEYMDYDLDQLCKYDFTLEEINNIKKYIILGFDMLNTDQAVLVHGDYDISHIFHHENKYSGLIDFGEVRGNHRFYDLATFIGFYQNETNFDYLLEGYSQVNFLNEEDRLAIELMALFILLRFLGKKIDHKHRNHWYKLSKKQLIRINKKVGVCNGI